MQKKTATIVITGLFIFMVCVFGVMYFLYNRGKAALEAEHQRELQKYSISSRLLDGDPLFRKTFVSVAQNSPDANDNLHELRSLYATGTPERNTIEVGLASMGVFAASTHESIAGLKRIVLDDRAYNRTARALAIEFMSRSYRAVNDPKILEDIFSGDPFFTTMLSQAGGDYSAALTKLLIYGYSLSPTPITSMRLAETASSALLSTKATPEQKQIATQYLDQLITSGLTEIQKMSGPVYSQYRAEFYSIYGGVLTTAIVGNISTKYSKTDAIDAFEKAKGEANNNFMPFVIYRYGVFLSMNKPVDTEKIESLSKELIALQPQDTHLFDVFLSNTLQQSKDDVRYKAVHSYMDASPTFRQYVSSRSQK